MTTYYPFRVGGLECAAVSAGTGRFNVRAFFADVPPGELAPVLTRHGIASEKIDTPFNCLLIRTAHGLVLIDSGAKPGPLTRNLRHMGIAPEDIRMVILSHAHPDHAGGLLDGEGPPVFPHARTLISRIERESAGKRLAPLQPEMIEEAELPEGISILAAPGHTAGQIAVKVASEGHTLLYTGDVIAHPIHLERPDWNIISDANRGEAIRTRAALLHQAAAEGWQLFVYHFPFPGLCRIERDGDRWRILERVTFAG